MTRQAKSARSKGVFALVLPNFPCISWLWVISLQWERKRLQETQGMPIAGICATICAQ